MTFQISSTSSTVSRQAATERINYDQAGKQSEARDLLRSAAELKKEEQLGAHLPIGDEQLLRMMERAVKALQGPHTSTEFSVHEATNTIMLKIMNSDTGELIREIPPEKTLDIVAKLIEVNGLLIDARV